VTWSADISPVSCRAASVLLVTGYPPREACGEGLVQVGPQAELITDQRPVLDQLVFVQHTRHGCGPQADGHYCLHPTNSPQY
jgi:hypothetical protein